MKTHTVIPGQAAGGSCPLAKTIFLRFLLILALGCPATCLNAATRNWTGDGALVGGVKFWSDPDNWSPHGVPQDGEDLVFFDTSVFSLDPMSNDLTNLTVKSLTFDDNGISDQDNNLYGNTLGISVGILNTYSLEDQVHIHCGLKLAGNATFATGALPGFTTFTSEDTAMYISGPIDLNGYDLVLFADADLDSNGRMYIEGGISGSGNILAVAGGKDTSAGGDPIYYEGSIHFTGTGNTFSGTLTLNSRPSSSIVFNVSPGIVVNDRLVVTNVGTVRLDRSEQIGDGATVRLSDGATLSLNGHAESIQNLELVTDSNDSRPSVLDCGSGGLLGLYGNITAVCNNSDQTPAIKGKITLTPGEHVFNVSGSAYAGLDIQAEILDDGNFTKTGNSALLLTANNSCSSSISIVQGILDVRHYHALGDPDHPTQILGGALLLRAMAIPDETLFAVGQGSGGVMPGSVLTSIGSSSWSGPVLLYTNLVVSGDMTFTGLISGNGGLGCFGLTTVHLTGDNTYTGTNYISGATLQVDGVQPLSPIDLHDDARLQGSGTVGNINIIGNSVVVAPGSSPGILTCGNFNAGATGSGTLEIELNGTTPGSGYDQINAQGTVNLTGLTLNASLGFSPAQEDSFTIINNDGTDPVTGTFPGLRQDKQVRIGGESFHVNYAGGTGNDLVLTRRGHDITWTNNSSGDWDAAQNWSPNLVPGTNDTVFIFKSVAVTLNSDVEIYSLTFGDSAGSPTLAGTGTLTITDAATWERGSMTGSGRTIIAAGATLLIANPTFTVGLSIRTLENGGTVFWTGANISLSSAAAITNQAGALFEILGAGTLIYGGGGSSRFDNAGIFRKSVNTGTTDVDNFGNFNNYGTVEIQTGTLLYSGVFINNGVVNLAAGTTNRLAASGSATGTFNAPATALVEWTGGTFTLDSGAQLNGAGLYRVNGGTVIVNGNMTVGNLELATALAGPGTVTVSTRMDWTGGTMSGVGRTVIPPGVTLNVANAGAVGLSTRTLENGGTVLWTGTNISLANSAVITNRAGALFEIQGAGTLIYGGAGSSRFDNTGNFRKSVNTGTTTVSPGAFNNYGTVEIQTGTLLFGTGFLNNGVVNLAAGTTNRLAASGSATGTFNAPATALVEWTGGTFTLDAGAQLNGAGLYRINGGTVTFNTNVTVGNLELATALGGPGTVTVSTRMDWTGGTMSGVGRTIIPVGAALNVANAGAVILSTRTLENGGTVLWTGTNISLSIAAVITNRAGALFGTQGAGSLIFGGGASSRLDNAGTFRKSINTGITTVSSGVFNNYGTVEILAGILAAGGGYTSTLNSLLNCGIGGTTAGTGYGQLQVAGTVALNGALSVSLATGFLPTTNDTFTVLSGTHAGAFAFFYYPSNKVTMQMSNTANSVIVSIAKVIVPPVLTIQAVPNNSVRLIWATNDPPFRLQSNTNLMTSNWTEVTPLPTVVGTNNVVTNAISGVQKYYRLSNP